MSINRTDVVSRLVRRPISDLQQALRVVGKDPDTTDPDTLAKQLADHLWWSYATPLGYVTEFSTLDDMVDHLAKRTGTDLGPGDAWQRLTGLTQALVPDGDMVVFDDLDPQQQKRLRHGVAPTIALGSSGASSWAAGRIGQLVMQFAATPIGRILPRIPQLAPTWKTVRGVAGVAARVGAPLGLVFAVAAINHSLGTNYRRFVPALLALGLVFDRPLMLGMVAEEADEVV